MRYLQIGWILGFSFIDVMIILIVVGVKNQAFAHKHFEQCTCFKAICDLFVVASDLWKENHYFSAENAI